MKMYCTRVNFAFAQNYSQTDMSTLKKYKQRLDETVSNTFSNKASTHS